MNPIQDSVNEIQTEIFNARENLTDGQYIKINNELSRIYDGNQEQKERNRRTMERNRRTMEILLRNHKKYLKSFLLIYFFNGDSDANVTVLENNNVYDLVPMYIENSEIRKNYYSEKLKESLNWMKSNEDFCRQMVEKVNSELAHFTISINDDNSLKVVDKK